MTIPRSRVTGTTPVAASPGRGPATRTEAGKAASPWGPGALANGMASAAVTPPSAILASRSAAALAGVNGVPVAAGEPAAMLSRAAVATTALPRNGTGATKLPSTSAAAAASR